MASTRYPNMTRAHFQLIAEVIAENGGNEELATAFADRLYGTNGKFDRDKFVRVATEGNERQEASDSDALRNGVELTVANWRITAPEWRADAHMIIMGLEFLLKDTSTTVNADV